MQTDPNPWLMNGPECILWKAYIRREWKKESADAMYCWGYLRGRTGDISYGSNRHDSEYRLGYLDGRGDAGFP